MKIPCIVYVTVARRTPSFDSLWAQNMAKSQCNLHVFNDNAFVRSTEELGISEIVAAVRPWAYKADLWRYALLAEKGGMFFDAELRLYRAPEKIFDLESDIIQVPIDRGGCLFQAMLASPPQSVAMKKVSRRATANVHARSYGQTDSDSEPWLGVTGPCTMKAALGPTEYRVIGKHRSPHTVGSNGKLISKIEDHIKSQFANQTTHYGHHWGTNTIYTAAG